jgi:hypothetical protein
VSTYLFVGHVEVAPNGTMTITRRSVGDAGIVVDQAAGNESAGVLVIEWSSNTFKMVDTETGAIAAVTGIPLSEVGGSNYVVPFATGTTYLVMHYGATTTQKLRRYSVPLAGGAASTLTPYMDIPDTTFAREETVFDEGAIIAVIGTFEGSSPDGTGVVMHLFDGTDADPVFTLVLYDGLGNTYWNPDTPLICGFAKVDGTYQVTYPRAVLVDIDGLAPGWTSYVRRSVDIVTGDLGPEVLVTDSFGSSVGT